MLCAQRTISRVLPALLSLSLSLFLRSNSYIQQVHSSSTSLCVNQIVYIDNVDLRARIHIHSNYYYMVFVSMLLRFKPSQTHMRTLIKNNRRKL